LHDAVDGSDEKIFKNILTFSHFYSAVSLRDSLSLKVKSFVRASTILLTSVYAHKCEKHRH